MLLQRYKKNTIYAIILIILLKNLPMSAKNSTFAAFLSKKLAAVWNIYQLVSSPKSMV